MNAKKKSSKDLKWRAGLAGLGAVGAAAGVSTVHSLRSRGRVKDDPYADEDFTILQADRSTVVTTPDGVSLAVREVGPADARLTVVFSHGFCNNMGSFHFQRARLAEQWGDQVRMVFYDQRGHGQSDQAPAETYTVPQLGQDLEAVLNVMVPRGPVVLVGHSMGGMTVLAHARQFPQHYPSRICGVAIIASAVQGVSRSPVGEVLQNPVIEAAKAAVRFAPKTITRGRGAARRALSPILRAASFGDQRVSRAVSKYSEKMINTTSMTTMIEFLHALESHDEADALPVLDRVPVLIACGDKDLLTPPAKSVAMARQLPKAELIVVPGAGHMVQMEQPDLINDALVRLVDRATPSALVALTRRIRDKTRRG